MKAVAVEFTYYTDIIEVPDHIADSIRAVQGRFDQWIYDKNNDHGSWIIENGRKLAVSFGTQDFVDYINRVELPEHPGKARILQENLFAPPVGMIAIWF